MLKGQIKYYFLIIVSIIGLCYLAISYADMNNALAGINTLPPPSNTNSTGAGSKGANDPYALLTTAQGEADGASKIADDKQPKPPEKPSELDLLKQIADNTYAFLKAFNYFSLNWLQIYTVPTSNALDTLFGTYVTSSEDNMKYQLALLKGGSFNILDQNGKPTKITLNSIYPLTEENSGIYRVDIPEADTNYASLVNPSQVTSLSNADAPMDIKNLKAGYFVKNASGINIYHSIPKKFEKTSEEYKKYITFANSIKAIASYNAYILNNHLADLQNDFKLNQTQTELKNKAGNNEWLTHINNEASLGVVLRQLLLFNSQMYVLMSDLLTTQKQQLAATAMTNALIIANSGYYEQNLVSAIKRQS